MKRVGGILLAAGASRRMGTPKALLHFSGRTALESILEAYAEARLDPLVVVSSGPALEYLRAPGAIDPQLVARLEVVEGDPEAPMIDSLARALEAIDAPEAVVVQPVDAPFTQPEMVAALLAGGDLIPRVLCHEGQAGHPVLIPRSVFDEIRERPAGGLRAILAEHEVELVEWPDSSVLADLDRPEDLERWRGFSGDLH